VPKPCQAFSPCATNDATPSLISKLCAIKIDFN
jgi:hypothetical protein